MILTPSSSSCSSFRNTTFSTTGSNRSIGNVVEGEEEEKVLCNNNNNNNNNSNGPAGAFLQSFESGMTEDDDPDFTFSSSRSNKPECYGFKDFIRSSPQTNTTVFRNANEVSDDGSTPSPNFSKLASSSCISKSSSGFDSAEAAVVMKSAKSQSSSLSSGVFTTRAPCALKNGSNKKKKKRSAFQRHVQWQWNDNSLDPFSQLTDVTLHIILSFLPMKDLLALSGVSHRWNFLSLQPACWQDVDATEFIHATATHLCSNNAAAVTNPNQHAAAAKKTGDILAHRLRLYAPKKLTIRGIGHRVQPESYLPSLNGLVELIITEFNELSDTHVHVMLLSSSSAMGGVAARSKNNSNTLRSLSLEDCPLLTNACVRSIGSQCRDLEYLSLKGCPNITSVMPLKDMFLMVDSSTSGSTVVAEQNTTVAPPSLSSIFVPPQQSSFFTAPRKAPPMPPAASGLSALFAPPPPKIKAPSSILQQLTPPPPQNYTNKNNNHHQPNSLASLFHPPVESSLRPPMFKTESGRTTITGGKLSRLNLSGTGVTALALAEALAVTTTTSPNTNVVVALDGLEMRGSGESWTDAILEKLEASPFKVLDIGCANLQKGSYSVTDRGIQSLTKTNFETLNLSGQKGIRTELITQVLYAATKLQSLNLAACPTLFKGDARTVAGMFLAFRKTRHLQYINLSRCFAEEGKATASPQTLKVDEQNGKLLLRAICTSASRQSLRELDLSWCWFVTAGDVAKVQTACPNLRRMHLLGTRCNQV